MSILAGRLVAVPVRPHRQPSRRPARLPRAVLRHLTRHPRRHRLRPPPRRAPVNESPACERTRAGPNRHRTSISSTCDYRTTFRWDNPTDPENRGGHMTTEVILTGTGVPHPTPGRAGAGTLVRAGQVAVQVDAGRATALRLAEAGTHPARLDALFLTHVHSDHVHDVPDLTMTRWLSQKMQATGPLPIVAPDGPTARYVRRMLAPFDDDIALRMAN